MGQDELNLPQPNCYTSAWGVRHPLVRGVPLVTHCHCNRLETLIPNLPVCLECAFRVECLSDMYNTVYLLTSLLSLQMIQKLPTLLRKCNLSTFSSFHAGHLLHPCHIDVDYYIYMYTSGSFINSSAVCVLVLIKMYAA